jgi:hypothetical protein
VAVDAGIFTVVRWVCVAMVTFQVKELVEASRAYTGPPVDVLLTNEWGQGVTAGMTTPPDVDREHGSPVVKDLALQLQPRWGRRPGGTADVRLLGRFRLRSPSTAPNAKRMQMVVGIADREHGRGHWVMQVSCGGQRRCVRGARALQELARPRDALPGAGRCR